MEFRLSPAIKAAQDEAERILEEVYYPAEEDILAGDSFERASADHLLGELKKRIMQAGLWAAELGRNNDRGLGFVGRVALEEKAGATILPGCDLGGNGDLLIWCEDPGVENARELFEGVIQGEKEYEVAYLQSNITESLSQCRVSAVEEDGKARLKGDRSILSNKRKIDFLIVQARLEKDGDGEPSFYLADPETKGVGLSNGEELAMGFRRLGIRLSDFVTAGKNRLVKEGQGYGVSRRRECLRNLVLGARSAGAAWRCIGMTTRYYQEHDGLNKHQAIQWMLADSVVEMHAARLLVFSQAQGIDEKKYDYVSTCISKVFSTEASCRAIEKMIQIWADKGCVKRFPFESLSRIVRLYRIMDQPSEVGRKNIAYGVMGREPA